MPVDMCIGFLLDCMDADLVTFPPNANVLEIGCAEADTAGALKARRPDLHVTAIDWRAAPECHADDICRGDILTHTFNGRQFDAVIAVSTIEHIGLGGYEQDPLDTDGDSHVMRRISHEWLRNGGICYLDVPYRPDGPYAVNGSYRAYDRQGLEERLIDPSTLTQTGEKFFDAAHPDGPYIALVLMKP